MVRLILTACLIFLANVVGVCAQESFVIGDDPGGLINAYVQKYDVLGVMGQPVMLTGVCVSACTLVLRLPREQVCATPGAMLGFHAPSLGTGPHSHIATKFMLDEFASLYPARVRRYLYSTAVHFEPARNFFKACK